MWALAAMLVMIAPNQGVASLGWLGGTWVSQDEGAGWGEEHWTQPRGGMILGTAFGGRHGAVYHFEYLRIVTDDAGETTLYAQPGGAPAVRFRLKRQTIREAVFENPRHDHPQRIRYAIDGRTLVTTVSQLDGSRAVSWRYRRR